MRPPEARQEARRFWETHVESVLGDCKRGYDRGYESAFWDAVLFCEQTSTPKPAWVYEKLQKYAIERIQCHPSQKRPGPHSHHFFDLYVFESVSDWRDESRIFGRKKKPRRFSFDEAFKMVQEELRHRDRHVEIGLIRAAYRRGKKMRSDPDSYYASMYMQNQI